MVAFGSDKNAAPAVVNCCTLTCHELNNGAARAPKLHMDYQVVLRTRAGPSQYIAHCSSLQSQKSLSLTSGEALLRCAASQHKSLHGWL